MVENPSVKRRAINRSIREIPVTISALSMGIFVTPRKNVRIFDFIACIPIAAAVPNTVAIRADKRKVPFAGEAAPF